jgi:hypothetical protein
VQQWTAYTDPEFGFTIHYPATWGTPAAKLVSGRTVIRFSEGFSVDIGQLSGANGQPTSYDELYASSKAESIANHSPMMDTDIGGRPGFILTSVSQATGGIVEVFAYTSYSDEDADIFRASYDLTPARNLTQADVDLFKRVVSTITFGN